MNIRGIRKIILILIRTDLYKMHFTNNNAHIKIYNINIILDSTIRPQFNKY